MRARRWAILTVTAAILLIGGVAGWQLRQPIERLWQLGWSRATEPEPIVFAVIGDTHGDNPVYRQVLRELPTYHPSFLLHLADATEHGTSEEFAALRQLEQSAAFPVYHTVGNHDILTDPTRNLYTTAFQQAPWTSFNLHQLHVVILDNADRKVGFPDASLQWLAHDLDQHQHDTTVIAYHRPFDLPLADVFGDDETAASRKTNQQFLDILGHANVAYIFTAHLHTYLAYRLHGIPAVVSGGGGGAAQSILGGPSHNFFHYLVVTVRGQRVTVDVHRVNVSL